ncbi:MAG: hypothetical protein L6M37_00820 [Candidatus Methylarchaceae archaeon HK02M1]|nr:hypothetical protein [Candidatus Methylarchaceae archaeon HK02M1]
MCQENYIKIPLGEDLSFIRLDSLEKLAKVDAIIFDCDGVIVDVMKSYISSIKETVNYIFSRLTGSRIEEKSLDRLIYILKKGGGFNNDWAVAYAISLLTLTIIPEELKKEFRKAVDSERFKHLDRPLDRLLLVEERLRQKKIDLGRLEESLQRLTELTERVGSSGKFFEKDLFSNSSMTGDDLEVLISSKRFLSYPGEVGEGLLMTVFEEIFLGCELFKEVYGQDCSFNKGRGLIENEKVILEKETLQKISSLIGRANFGIASGRPFIVSKYSMGELMDYFKPEARIFLDEVDKAEKDAEQRGEASDLSKPHPYSLLECSKNLKPFTLALYLGDTMADFMMVELANKIESRYLFGGVYSHFVMNDEQRLDFIKRGADIVIPSVRYLPYILKFIKEGKSFA